MTVTADKQAITVASMAAKYVVAKKALTKQPIAPDQMKTLQGRLKTAEDKLLFEVGQLIGKTVTAAKPK